MFDYCITYVTIDAEIGLALALAFCRGKRHFGIHNEREMKFFNNGFLMKILMKFIWVIPYRLSGHSKSRHILVQFHGEETESFKIK